MNEKSYKILQYISYNSFDKIQNRIEYTMLIIISDKLPFSDINSTLSSLSYTNVQ